MGGCPCFGGAAKVVAPEAAKPLLKNEAPKVSKPDQQKPSQAAVEPPAGAASAAAKAQNGALPKQTSTQEPAPEPASVVPPKIAPPMVSEPMPLTSMPMATFTGEAPQQSQDQELGMGSCMEIYSNTYGAWCPGIVSGVDEANRSLNLAYQVPGEPVDANISTKTLPADSPEIRFPLDDGSWLTASVEVYSHSNKAWCIGKVTEIVQGVLSVVFFYPNEPPDAVPVMKQLALGDKDLRLRGIDAAFITNYLPPGHDTLQVNSPVEVFSNSLNVWCPGIVQQMADGVATIAFYYPDMDPNTEQPAVKDLPLGHQDLRLPGFVTGQAYNSGPPVTEADIAVGGKLEVFSQSRQVWILAEIKEVGDGLVKVQLRYPDMPADSDLYEKVLPVGHADMRLPTDGGS